MGLQPTDSTHLLNPAMPGWNAAAGLERPDPALIPEPAIETLCSNAGALTICRVGPIRGASSGGDDLRRRAPRRDRGSGRRTHVAVVVRAGLAGCVFPTAHDGTEVAQDEGLRLEGGFGLSVHPAGRICARRPSRGARWVRRVEEPSHARCRSCSRGPGSGNVPGTDYARPVRPDRVHR